MHVLKVRLDTKKVLVVTDADNTLWDTNQMFADAQLALLDKVESLTELSSPSEQRLQFVRDVDQELAGIHHLDLKYPPKLLVDALARTLRGATPRDAARAAWSAPGSLQKYEELGDLFRAWLARKRPSLRAGVRAGLGELRLIADRLLVATESDRDRCDANLRHHGLRESFDGIVASSKNTQLFLRLRQRTADFAHRFSIGDQLDRDIQPAKMAGFVTIYFPSEFTPSWAPEESAVEPDFRIHSFVQVPEIVSRLKSRRL